MNKLINLALAASSVLFGIVCFELFAQLFLEPAVPYSRWLYYTRDSIVKDRCGAVGLRADASIQTAALYNGEVEYAVTFRTDARGFIDSGVAAAPSRSVAIVGNSVTAGFHGGEPWSLSLQRSLPDIQLINLGVPGTGLSHFRTKLNCAARHVAFDAIIIAAISDDILRPEWYPVQADDGVRYCRPDITIQQCLRNPPILRNYPAEGSPAAERDLTAWIKDNLYLYHLYRKLRWGLPANASIREADETILSEARLTLRRIRADFRDRPLVFLHLPEKSEVRAGVYRLALADLVREAGIEYISGLEQCRVTPDGFHLKDSHPNAKGYSQIELCVRKVLQRGD